MNRQKLIGPAGLAGALLVASLSGVAQAADEVVVYGAAKPTVVAQGQQVYRAHVEEYIRSFNRELRATIEADLKRQLAPKVQLASVAVATRG